MEEIFNQDDWNRIPKEKTLNKSFECVINAKPNYVINVGSCLCFITINSGWLHCKGGTSFLALGDSKVEAEDCEGTVLDQVCIWAYGATSVYAHGNAMIQAFHNAKISAGWWKPDAVTVYATTDVCVSHCRNNTKVIRI